MDLRGKKVVVIGFGKSGQSAVRLLNLKAASVIVSEVKSRSELPAGLVSAFESQGVQFETGGHSPETILSADLIVVSPGVSPTVYKDALKKGIPVISELELAWNFLSEKDKKIILDLARKYKVKGIILFGSGSETSGPNSDIDLGVEGVSDKLFFKFYSELIFNLSQLVDLVDISKKTEFSQIITLEGMQLKE